MIFGKKLKMISQNNLIVYNKIYLKVKMKYYKGKINTYFHNKKCQKKILNIFAYE